VDRLWISAVFAVDNLWITTKYVWIDCGQNVDKVPSQKVIHNSSTIYPQQIEGYPHKIGKLSTIYPQWGEK